MLAYRLDKPLSQIKLMRDIERLVAQSNINNNSILIVDIRTITSDNNSLVPKLEYKDLDC